MKMRKFFLLLIAVTLLTVLLASCECKHETFTEATCTSPSTCLECGEVVAEALGHTDGEWITDKEPNCTEDGAKHQVCSVCDATIKNETLTKLGHTDGEWITDKEPNCTEDGSKHQVCSVCNETFKTETLTKLGHTDVAWITVKKPTCTEAGANHLICSICDSTIKTQTLNKVAHTDGAWITDKEPNCTEDGARHQVCSVCNETLRSETLPKLGHTDGEWITDKEPTCIEDGLKHQVCNACNATINTEGITSRGHSYTPTAESNATPGTNAIVKYVCSTCGHSYTEEALPITVSAKLTGSGITISTGTYYTRSFEVTAHGGVGQLTYKFAAESNLLRDFSTSNEITVQGNALIDFATITITVMDEIGQKTVYQIRGDGSFVSTYVVYD